MRMRKQTMETATATAALLGIGTALPVCGISQGRAAELASLVAGHTEDEAMRLSVLYGLTGVARRHIAMLDPGEVVPAALKGLAQGPMTAWRMRRYDEQVRPIALAASAAALADSGRGASDLTHLVTVSCTGFAAPGFDLGLIRDLGLDPGVERTHVGFMGCHGALNGLRVARALAASEPGSTVLLCAAELCSLHFRFGGGTEQSVVNALFADGAAAAVVGQAEADTEAAGPESDLPDDGPRAHWRLAASGSVLIPGTAGAMTWGIGDHGFDMTLSPEIPALIRAHLPGWLDGWLGRQGLSTAAVGSWAVHPGGPRILDAVRDSLGLDRNALDDSRAVLAAYGNMSSPTILFILDRLTRRDAPRPCVALGFGPGLAVEAALFV